MAVTTRRLHILGTPSYINIGSFAEDESTYDGIADPVDILYGDLLDIISLRELDGLVNDDPSLDRIDWKIVRSTVLKSESEVNAYLARRYAIPAITKLNATDVVVPNQVFDWTSSILRYRFYKRRPAMPEDVLEDYKMTIRQLEMAGQGRIQIVELTLDADGIPTSDKPTIVGSIGTVNRETNIMGRNTQGNVINTGGFNT